MRHWHADTGTGQGKALADLSSADVSHGHDYSRKSTYSRYILISVDFLGLGRFARVYWTKIVVLGIIVLSLLAALHDPQTTLNLARQLAELERSLTSVTLLAGMKVSKSNRQCGV